MSSLAVMLAEADPLGLSTFGRDLRHELDLGAQLNAAHNSVDRVSRGSCFSASPRVMREANVGGGNTTASVEVPAFGIQDHVTHRNAPA
ncbi:MAG TPA: hypothetical protein VJ608_06165 [Albitalea sp.]|nr:hypothetical protein [Albitalea sp.]